MKEMQWTEGVKPTFPRKRSRTLDVAWACAAVVILVAGCKKAPLAAPPPPIVQVMEVTATNVPMHTKIIGQLDSPQNVEIRARVEAFVQEMPFVEGTNVVTGQLLFKLDDAPYKESLATANGNLGEAEAALKKYEADVARLKPLAEKRAVPQQDLDNALASVDVGKAAVFSAKARVDSALLNLSYCEVNAPTNGLIGAKQVSIGELVGKGLPTLMATMSTLDPIWFYCNVSEVDYLRANAEVERTGRRVSEAPITLLLSDGTEHPEKGKLVFLDRAVDVKTGTLRMRAEFPNPGGVLRPGMFARIRIDLGARPDSILVPERAVTELQGKNFAWVIDPDNKATQRAVQVGETIGDGVMILAGLKAGERIITEGLQKVREGMPVQPKTAAQMAAAAAEAAKHVEASHAQEGAAQQGKE